MRLLHPWIGVPVGLWVAIVDRSGAVVDLELLLVCYRRAEVKPSRLFLCRTGNDRGGEFRQVEVTVAVTAGATSRESRIGDRLEADRGKGRQFGPKLQRVHSSIRGRAADENAAIGLNRQRFAALRPQLGRS